ncbi:MAG: hypothetical protein ACLPUT_01810 [Solirubrobacteraceae bacterium]
MSGPRTGGDRTAGGDRSVTVHLQGFGLEAIEQESARMGVSVEDLASFAVQYYLADVDSGRISRRISRSPYPEASSSSSADALPPDASS